MIAVQIVAILIASAATIGGLLMILQILWNEQRFERMLMDFFRQHDWHPFKIDLSRRDPRSDSDD